MIIASHKIAGFGRTNQSIIFSILKISTLLFASTCLACAARGPKATTDITKLTSFAQEAEKPLDVAELNKKISAAFAATPSYEDYVLDGGDLIQVSIFEAPDLNTEARVS
ncbi:MAG: hypothetical protein EOM44_15235, partial [Bacteroidia bacterium]|nr:hypothetical protein [Bacteroidia bacterium]